MAFGAIEIIGIIIVAFVFFGVITKEQWAKGRNKVKEVIGEFKEIEYDFREDVAEVETKVKTKRRNESQTDKETVSTNSNIHS